jgi:hypothetical protein
MKSKYSEIVKHIPSLEDHGHLYMYYGIPYSEESLGYIFRLGSVLFLVLFTFSSALRAVLLRNQLPAEH